jgi:hypothetical protein
MSVETSTSPSVERLLRVIEELKREKAAAVPEWKGALLANAAEAFIEEICTWMPAMSNRRPEVALRMRDLRLAIKTVRET